MVHPISTTTLYFYIDDVFSNSKESYRRLKITGNWGREVWDTLRREG